MDHEQIERLLADAEQQLNGAVGASSLCAISRSGARVDGAKYLEGRVAALRDLLRGGGNGTDVTGTLQAVGATWRAALAMVVDNDMGPVWIAYRTGGVDVLEEVAAAPAGDGEGSVGGDQPSPTSVTAAKPFDSAR